VTHKVVDVGEAVGEEVGFAFWVAGGFEMRPLYPERGAGR